MAPGRTLVFGVIFLSVFTSASLADPVLGDFNGNGERDPADIDLMTDQMLSNNPDLAFDLNGDQSVNFRDRHIWVEELTNTYIGDSNFDGRFNSSDLVLIFAAAKYESGIAATWAEGDFNGDARFTSNDFIWGFVGRYENAPREGGLRVVPEPVLGATQLLLLMLAAVSKLLTSSS